MAFAYAISHRLSKLPCPSLPPHPKIMPSPDSERPLVEDIRLLGRILGDVIREQEGEDAYALIEQIRQLSVSFRRHADPVADKALNKLLKSLSSDQTVSVVRAFTYFSHLANLAEDRHHIRRNAIHARAGHSRPGSIDVTLKRLRQPRHHAASHQRDAGAQFCLAGAHRPPHRGAAQKHSGCRARHCQTAHRHATTSWRRRPPTRSRTMP